jgi:peptidoglycan-associated lipoprotein
MRINFSRRGIAFAGLLLSSSLLSCRRPPPQAQAPAPPPAAQKQNLFVLLPEPDGKPSGISMTNPAGSQTITQPYQAIRVQSAGVAPAPPFAFDEAAVQRLFGAVIDALPAAEMAFTLYFGENSDMLDVESEAQVPSIAKAIRDRRSTAISLIGHTDTTGASQSNYQLGLRRAQTVAAILGRQGAEAGDLFIESHGDADLLVKTDPGVAERRNRRVEVIVR